LTGQPVTDAQSWLADYGDNLFAYALPRVGGNRAVAEDLVQETLLAGIQGFSAFQADSSVETWLTSILRRKVVDHYRRSGRSQEVPSDDVFFSSAGTIQGVGDWGGDPALLAENREFRGVLQSCLAALNAPLAEAFVAVVMDGLETEAACKLFKVTPTNLSVRLHRARLGLRRCLEKKWYGRR
jgi:RNA polymerase sigma-70 factor (ECF subfamily)